MKAVLVIDSHIGDCETCPCFHEDRTVCQAGGLYGKPCPLRPISDVKAKELENGSLE